MMCFFLDTGWMTKPPPPPPLPSSNVNHLCEYNEIPLLGGGVVCVLCGTRRNGGNNP
jgi:hypothetical protein